MKFSFIKIFSFSSNGEKDFLIFIILILILILSFVKTIFLIEITKQKEIFLTVILLSLLFSIIQCQKQEEIEALEHFYSSTNGGYWYNNSNWLVGSPCSNNWHGVTCDGDNNIIKLELNINFLTGNISDLSNLSSLQVLDLSENYLSGSFVSSFWLI